MDSKLYSKCQIIADMYDAAKDVESWEQFFFIYDVGIPLARMIALDCAEPTLRGVDLIDETWYGLCHMIGIDHEADYESLNDMFEVGAVDES
jgi:hypothetical protein